MKRMQYRGAVIGRETTGGGVHKTASLYRVRLEDGRVLDFDYIEIASDGFRTVGVGDEVWCSVSEDAPGWATYVIPIVDLSSRELLGLPVRRISEMDPVADLWL